MVDSISSMGNPMAMMRGGGMQGPPPPKDKDVFQIGDSDGDGVISATELSEIAEGIEKVTGSSINVEDALSNYDANQDGGLSGEELLEMLASNGFSRREMMGGEDREEQMKPPPPPPPEQVAAAYGQNSSPEDQLIKLLELLHSSDDESEYNSIDVSS